MLEVIETYVKRQVPCIATQPCVRRRSCSSPLLQLNSRPQLMVRGRWWRWRWYWLFFRSPVYMRVQKPAQSKSFICAPACPTNAPILYFIRTAVAAIFQLDYGLFPSDSPSKSSTLKITPDTVQSIATFKSLVNSSDLSGFGDRL